MKEKTNESVEAVTHTHTHGFLKNKNNEVKRSLEVGSWKLEVRKKEKNSNFQPLTSNLNKNTAITLIALVITIVVLVILAGVVVAISINKGGLIKKAIFAREETAKQNATDKLNLKLTNIEIQIYSERQESPTLQEVADFLCEDGEIEYVTIKQTNMASDKITVGTAESIFTKLYEYKYEFEINSNLQIVLSDNKTKQQDEETDELTTPEVSESVITDSWASKNTWEKLQDIGFTLNEIANNELVFSKTLVNEDDIQYMLNDTQNIMQEVTQSTVAMKLIGNNKNIYKKIFGDTDENIEVNTTWVQAILASSNAIAGLDQTSPITVPNMTSNTTPSGEAKASSLLDSSNLAWKAFNTAQSSDKDDWHSGSMPAWVQYKFTQPVLVYKFYIQNRYQTSTWVNSPRNFQLLGSNDEESWDVLGTYEKTSSAKLQGATFVVENINKRYLYYRIYVTKSKRTDGTTDSAYVSIGRLQFYGK